MSPRWALSFAAGVIVIMWAAISMLQPLKRAAVPLAAPVAPVVAPPAVETAPSATTASAAETTAPISRMVTLEVGGMVCSACVDKIQHELSQVAGVHRAEVDLESREARVLCGSDVADTTLIAAVRRAGPQYLGLIVNQ